MVLVRRIPTVNKVKRIIRTEKGDGKPELVKKKPQTSTTKLVSAVKRAQDIALHHNLEMPQPVYDMGYVLTARKLISVAKQWETDERDVRDGPLNAILLSDLYLVASRLYYHFDMSIISDGAYDRLCKRLHENFEFVCKSRYDGGVALDKSSLKAGTGFAVKTTAGELWLTEIIKGMLDGQPNGGTNTVSDGGPQARQGQLNLGEELQRSPRKVFKVKKLPRRGDETRS